MAWRIGQQVIRGELDNHTIGKVSGLIWLEGQPEPMRLCLEGNPWRDWAGCVLRFQNPKPEPGDLNGLATEQIGVCGDMTASRKVRIPPEPVSEWLAQGAPGKESLPWGNCVYLEWFSERNGRVVIESTRFDVELSGSTWSMTQEQEKDQGRKNQAAMEGFMTSLAKALQTTVDAESADPPGTESEESEVAGDLQLLSQIEELKRKAREMAGGKMIEGLGEEPLPLSLQHQFWQNVVDFESAPRKTRREILAEDGFDPPPVAALSDTELSNQLWRLIEALAARRMYLESTNHLSDRELYTLLVERVLEEETEVLPPEGEWNCRICVDEYGGPGSEDGRDIYLRFYADTETRAQWRKDFPGEIPPHCDPRYNRDRQLPH